MSAVAPLDTEARIGTGSAQIDEILGGGFLARSINLLMGHPGTGKTILAEQLLFHNAGRGRPVVFLSTLSEPLSKVVTYLQRFAFYDERKMFESVVYEDVGPGILEEGVGFLGRRLRELIREIGPRLIVIDSFKVVHDLAESVAEARRLVSDVAGLLSAYDATTFLVGEYDDRHVSRLPEFAVADGILQLVREASGKRDDRYLRVLKLRGSRYREGLHAFRIATTGLEVYPRIVTPEIPVDYSASRQRVTTGMAALDPLLGGGLLQGTSALVMGRAGTGKTTFALGFALEGARRHQPSLVVNLQENPEQLWTAIALLGGDQIDTEELHLQYVSPVELQIDSMVVDLFRTVEKRGIRRVVVDSVGELALASSDPQRLHDYLYTLLQHLAVRGITSVLTLEVHQMNDYSRRLSSMSDAILALDVDFTRGSPQRRLRIVKARGTAHPLEPLPIRIGAGGIDLRPVEERT